MSTEHVIEMLGIVKEFPGIRANDGVELRVKRGEIHALLGENGAGKSTLMSVLFGLYEPENGEIRVGGTPVRMTNPTVATRLGVGMVHQHFNLVENFTVFENIILGVEHTNATGTYEKKNARKKIKNISKEVGLHVELDARIQDIPVSMQQRVEILKMLYRDATILIFDEPTAVLTPQEIDDLLNIMKVLASKGNSIVFITHKLKEILAIADSCTVLRRGKSVGCVDVAHSSKEELARMMVGRSVEFNIQKEEAKIEKTMLSIEKANVYDDRKVRRLNNVSIDVHGGEIVGIAGIEGNGQRELGDAITGIRALDMGRVVLDGEDITKYSIRQRMEAGVACIPEDRHRDGLVLDFSLSHNIVLGEYYKEPFSRNSLLRFSEIEKHTEELIEKFDIRCGEGANSNARGMSGGNQQKAIIAREVTKKPKVLIAIQPTRGLDVGAIEYVHTRIIEERDRGAAVLLVSYDLDEILQLTDTVVVMSKGNVSEVVRTKDADYHRLGLAMTGISRETAEEKPK